LGRRLSTENSRTTLPSNINLERPILNAPLGQECRNGKRRCRDRC
jgi:hypothetical protein